jgi:hypothetical protein
MGSFGRMVIGAASVFFAAHAFGQSCSPGPACSRANEKGLEFLQRMQAGQVNGILDAASKEYCLLLVGIELNNLCASEFRGMGNSTCASLAEQQVVEMRRALKQAESVASATSINNTRNRCVFE